VILLVSQ